MANEQNGILVIDKPEHISSAKVVARVKKLLNIRKAGHTGTLDPFATGVMICCLNRATKLARFFLHGNKTYQAVLRLGVETDTQDATGTVISTSPVEPFSEEKIQTVFKSFEGEMRQEPPIYSALKHKGVPLYKLARQGKPVQKEARSVLISSIDIQKIHLPEICFEVSCGPGTYIRTLCADIGAALGCGGHLQSLRRTKSSDFTIREAVTLAELEELVSHGTFNIINMADALRNMPCHVADDTLTRKIMYGNAVSKDQLMPEVSEKPVGFIKVVNQHNALLAVLNYTRESNMCKYCCAFS